MKKEKLPDFSGKCLSIALRDDSFSHDLYDPHFEYQGGILFIIGTIPKGATESDWSANHTGAVAWSSVKDYVIFENLNDYNKSINKSEE